MRALHRGLMLGLLLALVSGASTARAHTAPCLTPTLRAGAARPWQQPAKLRRRLRKAAVARLVPVGVRHVRKAFHPVDPPWNPFNEPQSGTTESEDEKWHALPVLQAQAASFPTDPAASRFSPLHSEPGRAVPRFLSACSFLC
jgi:hypothetical protein